VRVEQLIWLVGPRPPAPRPLATAWPRISITLRHIAADLDFGLWLGSRSSAQVHHDADRTILQRIQIRASLVCSGPQLLTHGAYLGIALFVFWEVRVSRALLLAWKGTPY
jgi:hypothetical protein